MTNTTKPWNADIKARLRDPNISQLYIDEFKVLAIEAADCIADLERALGEASKDAELYRRLRCLDWIDDAIMEARKIVDGKPETLDAAIAQDIKDFQ